MIKIAVDAMGGDFAPEEIVLGSVAGAREYGCEVFLVGDESQIREVLKNGRIFGYGNMISHLKEAWIQMLITKYDMDRKTAEMSANVESCGKKRLDLIIGKDGE